MPQKFAGERLVPFARRIEQTRPGRWSARWRRMFRAFEYWVQQLARSTDTELSRLRLSAFGALLGEQWF